MALPEAGVQLVADGLSGFMSDMGKANKEVADFGKAGTTAGNAFNKGFGEIVTGALREVGAMAVQALGKATQALAGFGKQSVDLAGDFESGMLDFQAVAGKEVDASGLEEFRDLFIQIGKELPVSTSDVQNAATEMIKGGIDPAIVAAGGLRQNIQFAAAAMEGDLVKAAEISGKILGGWAASSATAQEKADFLTHATDLLTKAANASAVDVEGLSLGIFNAQGIAKTAGVSFDDLTTTLAALAPRFASSSEAGNSLKNMIARLQPTTKSATGAMTALGLYTEATGSAFYDAQGNFIGFEQSAQLLQESLAGLTKEQQASLLQTIFGNDAMGSAAALADMGAEGYRAMAEAMLTANGVAENAALKQQGFNTALDNAKGSIEALQITIGTALLPILTDLLENVIAPGINTLTDMADALFGNDEAFSRLSPTMQEVVSTIGTVIIGTQAIVGAFNEAGAMSSEFGESIGALASDLGLPGELIQDIVFGAQDLIASFQQGGAAAQVLGAIFEGQVKNYQTLFSTLGDFIPGILTSIETITKDVLGQIATFWWLHGQEVMTTITTAMQIIGDIYNTVLQIILTLVGDKLTTMAAYFHSHADQIQQVIKGAWDIISGVVIAGLTLIQGALKIALDIINGDWAAAWGHLQEMSATFVLAITKAITGFLDIIAAAFGTSLTEIGQTWSDIWSMAQEIITKFAADAVAMGADIVSGIISGVKGSASKLYSALSDLANSALDAAKSALGISSPSQVMEEQVGAPIVQGMIAGIQGMLPELLSVVADMGDELTNAAQDIADAVSEVMQSGFTATANIDRQKLKNLKDIKGLSVGSQTAVAMQLEDAQKQAMQIADPKQAADFFKQRSAQVFELAELNDQIIAATEAGDKQLRNDLIAQYQLINAAQLNETKAAAMDRQQGGTLQQLVESVYAAMAAGLPVNDTGIGALLSSFADRAGGMISQPASAQQIAGAGGGNTYASNTSYTMPIYTNNSPAALQQSLAVAQALTPA